MPEALQKNRHVEVHAALVEAATGLAGIDGLEEARQVVEALEIDLDADDRAAEVERLVGLGASVVHDRDEYGKPFDNWAHRDEIERDQDLSRPLVL